MNGTDVADQQVQATFHQTELTLALVAQVYGVETKELRIATRGNPRAALARQVAMYLCHVVFRIGVSALANGFARTRSTVLHAVRHIEEMRDDPEIDRVLLQLEIMLCRAEKEAA